MSKVAVVVVAVTLIFGLRMTALNNRDTCGTGTVVNLKIEERGDSAYGPAEPSPISGFPEPAYTLTFRLDDMVYTAESAGGRLALFGPFVVNAKIELCVVGDRLVLNEPRDDEPEVLAYEMAIVRKVRVRTDVGGL